MSDTSKLIVAIIVFTAMTGCIEIFTGFGPTDVDGIAPRGTPQWGLLDLPIQDPAETANVR